MVLLKHYYKYKINDEIVICAIVKQEHLYIDEWIKYHLLLGFDRIYIYDNDEKEPCSYLEELYPTKVKVIRFLGRGLQMFCYDQFLRDYYGMHKWVAFIDVDEFIVLRTHNHIKNFVTEYCKEGAIALNWVLYGSSGLKTYSSKPVLQRFTMRQIGVNKHVKLIGIIDHIAHMISPHHCILRTGKTYDCNGTMINGPYNEFGNDEVACVNHYFTKSEQEFREKCMRGRADLLEYRTFEADFYRHDINETVDTSAWDFLQNQTN